MAKYDKIRKMLNITVPNGFTLDELEVCKSKFTALPQSMVDYYTEFGRCKCINGHPLSRLLTPRQLISKKYRLKQPNFLVFYIEDISNWCGVSLKQLEDPNPPVYVYDADTVDGADEENGGWKHYCNSVQDFFIAQAYKMAYFLHQYCSVTIYEVSLEALVFIMKNYKGKGMILTTYRTENQMELDNLHDHMLNRFFDDSYQRILKSYGNRNHYDAAKFLDIYHNGTRTAYYNNDGGEDISILERSTMFFGNHDDSLIVFDGVSMHYSSGSEDHFLEMDRDFSTLKELVKFSKPHSAGETP